MTLLIVLYGPMMTMRDDAMADRNKITTISDTIQSRKDSQREYQKINAIITQINDNEINIIDCINIQDKCDTLSEDIQESLPIVKAYLQVNKLDRPKMIIDESKILKNINEFMVRDDSYPGQVIYNGDITNIIIGEPSDIENKMIKVPVTITVTFNDKENLITFLHRIENEIFYEPESGLDNSILFRIDELKYDITQYSETQDVEILLSAYAYKE